MRFLRKLRRDMREDVNSLAWSKSPLIRKNWHQIALNVQAVSMLVLMAACVSWFLSGGAMIDLFLFILLVVCFMPNVSESANMTINAIMMTRAVTSIALVLGYSEWYAHTGNLMVLLGVIFIVVPSSILIAIYQVRYMALIHMINKEFSEQVAKKYYSIIWEGERK